MAVSDRDFGRFESKVDQILENQRLEREAREELEKRVGRLEVRQAIYAGASAVLAFIAAHFSPWSVRA